MAPPVTRIGSPTSDVSRLVMRGRNVLTDILGKMTFSEAFYFIVTGKDIERRKLPLMDACMIVLMDHGITPTAIVARLIADSLPGQAQIGIAAGTMMIGEKFVGTMTGMGSLLLEGVASGKEPRVWARETVENAAKAKKRLPGFGHPYYNPTDPRTLRLMEIAREHGIDGPYMALVHILSEEIDRVSGKHLTLNVTGALGALLCELGFPAAAMRGLAVVSRAAGLVAHTVEESSQPVSPAFMEFAGEIEYRDPE
ncbi:citryl-CoA lyase [Rhodoplanes sp. Z2-YC6860]|uniref:citryl-CoA lyase n=1 Tax=Rhodoplanes sp. Z2-YC6860 TaxID=674703 RepID=UPI00078DFB42|nr:citryl-CoA lyase [Rhodoplanes sp. Z2-YC6860]AMN41493.1 citrate synthase [Rhodoplanes sp. Z2-YC6860]